MQRPRQPLTGIAQLSEKVSLTVHSTRYAPLHLIRTALGVATVKGKVKAVVDWGKYVLADIQGKPVVAHHGIERSGTNLLREVVEYLGTTIANEQYTSAGAIPGHKHLRLQPDKSTIVSSPENEHQYVPASLSEYNAQMRFPADMRHLVIFKDPANWIVSMNSYAKRAGYPRGGEILDDELLLNRYLTEWSEYYRAWEHLAKANPHQVLMLQYEAWMTNFQETLQQVAKFLSIDTEHLPQSPLEFAVKMSGARDAVVTTISNADLADKVYQSVSWHGFEKFN